MKSLKASIKQSKPFKSVKEELLLTLVRTAADIEHQMTQDFRPFGLTTTQYNVLRILRGAGAEGLCRHEVGDRLVRQVPDVTRLLDRMEQAGLIVRERGSMDRRYVSTRLTPQGLALVNRMDAEIDGMQHRYVGHLNEKQMKALLSLLEALREGANSE
jgi:DNA-binding MarR family transcriptional regulator